MFCRRALTDIALSHTREVTFRVGILVDTHDYTRCVSPQKQRWRRILFCFLKQPRRGERRVPKGVRDGARTRDMGVRVGKKGGKEKRRVKKQSSRK